MSEQTKAVVRDCWAAANSGKPSEVAKFYAPDAVYHGGGDAIKGRDNIVAFLDGYFTAFPDMKLTIEDIFAEGDRVFSRVRAEGTNKGAFMGQPPTGKRVDLRWIMNVARVDGGLIAEEWEIVDGAEMMKQLGVAP
jgi:steroid delta-isomerase-like uncharacterized protein